METPKQKAIREAYGEHWDIVKPYVNEGGWCNYKSLFGDMGNSTGRLKRIDTEVLDHHHPIYCYFNRPKSLEGIQNNNGWTFIESEADLPIEVDVFCHVSNLNDNKHRVHNSPVKRDTIKKWFKEGKVTHYKPIEKPNSPIY